MTTTAMSTFEILPTRVIHTPEQSVGIEVRGLTGPATLEIRHLGDLVAGLEVSADGVVDLGQLPAGGYSVQLGEARTAVEVTATPRAVLRYGFVVDYRPDRDLSQVSDNLRRLHLTGVQFYDWAYRHADLLGGGEQYDDALGQPVALDTVRRLVEMCHQVGADARHHESGHTAQIRLHVARRRTEDGSYSARDFGNHHRAALGSGLAMIDMDDTHTHTHTHTHTYTFVQSRV